MGLNNERDNYDSIRILYYSIKRFDYYCFYDITANILVKIAKQATEISVEYKNQRICIKQIYSPLTTELRDDIYIYIYMQKIKN